MFEEPEPETSARDRETYMVAANTETDLHQVKQRLDELIDKVNALHLGPNIN